MSSPNLFFFSIVFGCLGFIAIHMNLSISFTIFTKKDLCDFESTLNLCLLRWEYCLVNNVVFQHMNGALFLFIYVFNVFQQYFIIFSVPVLYFLELIQLSLLFFFFGAPGEEQTHNLWQSLLFFLLLL